MIADVSLARDFNWQEKKKIPLAPALVGLPVLGGRPKRSKSREAGIKIGEKKEVSLIMCQCPALLKEPLHTVQKKHYLLPFLNGKKKKKGSIIHSSRKVEAT